MAFNLQGGLSSGIQGAQLGGQVGGVYGAIGGGILGLLAGGSDNSAAEAVKKYNDAVVKNAAQDLFDMRRQQNIQNMRTARTLANYAVQNKTAASTITASLGAADIIGSSATALKQAMDYQTKQAQADTMLNWGTEVDNYNRAIDTATEQRVSSLQRSTGQELDVGALVQGGMALYSGYNNGFEDMFGLTPAKGNPITNASAPVSMMDSLKHTWEGGSGLGLPTSTINPQMKTFKL
ncbi:internal virion protein B [Vibrio phage vB_VhaP_VH-5]|uniref:Internal virion protein B n=1 Tax=Vibrio phage vB_VhaP_VH-5 TaxID=2660694 RepID=A0A5Q2W945_9CAUD|nr:internal virion protein B [Vibrio phage vB_VhaP_VH-5]